MGRANNLDGKNWLKNSLSIWKGLSRSEEERQVGHPAMFPIELVKKLIDCFVYIDKDKRTPLIFDPFVGSGTTLLAATDKKIDGLGFELKEDYYCLANERLAAREDWTRIEKFVDSKNYYGTYSNLGLRLGDARTLCEDLAEDSLDLTITSPPYWDILNRRRTADNKERRFYSKDPQDLGNIDDYSIFLEQQRILFSHIYRATRNKGYLIVIVMDIRKKNIFYPFHMDLAHEIQRAGFNLDDIIIWDRGDEYNNLRPLGYPYVFRINKIHEYILIFQRIPDKP